MRLPYSKVETYDFGGKIYPDEQSVLKAAIEEVLGNPGVAATVLGHSCALAPLLARVCELKLEPDG
jgi:hypothetical protein